MASLFSFVACWGEKNYYKLTELARTTYQISLRGHRDEDHVVPHPDLLSLRPLLGGGVDSPPAGLAWHNKYHFRSERGNIINIVIGDLITVMTEHQREH